MRGNIRTVVPDIKEPLSLPQNQNFRLPTLTLNNYYPYGMLQAGRSRNAGGYRFGYQGQEADNKIGGLGQHLNYTFRNYDSWIIRFGAIDPLSAQYAYWSPFAFSGNRVIDMIELEGAEIASPYIYLRKNYPRITGVVDGTINVATNLKNLPKSLIDPNTYLTAIKYVEEVALSSSPVSDIYSPNTPMLDAQVKELKDDLIYGDAYSRSKYLTELTENAALSYYGGKALGKVSSKLKAPAVVENAANKACFIAGTTVATANGQKDIKDLVDNQPNNLKLSTDTTYNVNSQDHTLTTYLSDTQQAAQTWNTTPISIANYTTNQTALQQQLNNAHNLVWCYQFGNTENNLPYDNEPITPQTWKWIHLITPQASSQDTLHIDLCRPNWWLLQANADTIGKQVFVEMPEFGVQDWATITQITPNYYDSRFQPDTTTNNYVLRPIIGKFKRQSSDVYQLNFEGNSTPLGVTANHPIYSADRQTWVPAAKLQIGEHVQTRTGTLTLQSSQAQDTTQTVYNLEIYGEHNYLVQQDGLWVHNGCLPKISVVADDWVVKGAHVHVGEIEVALKPTANGGITFKKVFSSTSDVDFNRAVTIVKQGLANPEWKAKLLHSVEAARDYMPNVEGRLSGLANGRAAELNFLSKALKK